VKNSTIYLITEGESTQQNFPQKKPQILNLIKIAVSAGINLIQIREKKLPARFVYELASEAVKITQKSQTKILINDRADIAFAAKADGVHLTSTSIPTKIVRANFPKEFIIGVSTHTIEEAENAKKDGANFVTFSPIFATPSKEKYGKPQGLENLREVCEKLENFPVIALGGIDETNYKQVLENGASGFAAIRFLNDEKNLVKFKK
jgi:thiamine-phosphate pyrophosphorylase